MLEKQAGYEEDLNGRCFSATLFKVFFASRG